MTNLSGFHDMWQNIFVLKSQEKLFIRSIMMYKFGKKN